VSSARLLDAVRAVHPFRVTGRVELVRGLLLEATLPGARVASPTKRAVRLAANLSSEQFGAALQHSQNWALLC